jgi:hypothetical protein
MNRIMGKRMKETFFKYYHGKPIESREDKDMLDKLVAVLHIEYSLKNGKAYARASDLGKGLHYYPPEPSVG